MSSEGSWHLLYYSPCDSTNLSCCTQPRGFNLRWLILEITFFLLPPPPIPLFQSGGALSICSALPQPSMREHWQPEITSLPVPVDGLHGAAARSWGLPCSRAREATVILGILAQTQADFLVRCCWSWRCPTPGHVPGAVPSPCFFQSRSVVFRRHYSASLKKKQKTQNKTKKTLVRWRKGVLTK